MRVPDRYASTKAPGNAPRISIVTPSLNQSEFIERTLLSVLDQGYPALEYIVQDGGSTDGTLEILDRYREGLNYLDSRADDGQGAAINAGHSRSTGEILCYLNADDLLLPGSLAYVGRYFSQHPDIDVVYGHRIVIDAQDKEVGRWVLPPDEARALSWVNFIPQETLFWRRRVWDAVGGIDEAMRFALDWDLTLRFRQAGARFVRLPRFLGAIRIHKAQKLATLVDEGAREARLLRERTHGRQVTQAEALANTMTYLVRHVFLDRLYRLGLVRY